MHFKMIYRKAKMFNISLSSALLGSTLERTPSRSKFISVIMSVPIALIVFGLCVGQVQAIQKKDHPLALHSPVSLAHLFGEMRPVIRYYTGEALTNEIRMELRDGATITDFRGVKWVLGVKESAVAGEIDARDFLFTWTVVQGNAEQIALGIATSFKAWSSNNFVMLPGAVYDGNRFEVKKCGWPGFWTDVKEWKIDMPTTINGNDPTLGKGNVPGKILLNTGHVSTPLMAVHSASRHAGWMILTNQGSRLGNHGLVVEEDARSKTAIFTVTVPSVRFGDEPTSLQEGESLSLACRVYTFYAPERIDLFQRFFQIRKNFNYRERREELPFSEAWKLLNSLYQADRWDEESGMYWLGGKPGKGLPCFIWSLGWLGGGQATLPILIQGDEIGRARAIRNLDVIFTKTQAPSGFFYAAGDGKQFVSYSMKYNAEHGESLIRSQADWLTMAQRQTQWLESTGFSIPVHWNSGLCKLADAFVKLWNKRGQFGQWINVETGDIYIGNSTSGGAVPGGLALAYRLFRNQSYLEVAKASARKYHMDFCRNGYTTGGPGEALSAPDSESAFGLFESFMTLYEVTGETEWLQKAADILPLCASWTVSYDYVFPPHSALGRIGIHSCGAVWANVQNKHASPAICTWSGDALLKFFRATGDIRALELLTDIAHGVTQYISRYDRKVGNMIPGGICERINLSDWERKEKIGGNIFGSSSWVETAAMLTVTQVPGLYVQPDSGVFATFDNIRAEMVSHSSGMLKLRLWNPTKFPADIKVFSESSLDARKPLSMLVSPGMRIIHLEGGETTELEFR